MKEILMGQGKGNGSMWQHMQRNAPQGLLVALLALSPQPFAFVDLYTSIRNLSFFS